MKTKAWFAILLIVVFINGCKLKEDGGGTVVEPDQVDNSIFLSGKVVNHATSQPIANATVSILDLSDIKSTITDVNGLYDFELEVEEATGISIVAAKEGLGSDTVSVNIAPGKTVTATDLRLKQSDGITVISDDAASIYLLSQSEEKLGIIQSGDTETALATFQVIDSSGVPIDERKIVQVKFSIVAGPGGGEFLYPEKINTNESGQASVAITTGTKAGVVQVMAEIVSETKVIRSKPVFFTIYGGFPVQERFKVASEKSNYPYWGEINREIEFTALLGDKYSNPVRPNTSVYFNTTSGVIGDFVYTDILGRATSRLVTLGDPELSPYGDGYFEVYAWTVTENSETIFTKTLRLLSYAPIISDINPLSFDIANGGGQSFTFTVMDFNGNPISSDYSISIGAEGSLTVKPDAIRIPDALFGGTNITEFSFAAGDGDPEEDIAASAEIIITIAGPHGTFTATISGTTH